MAGEKLRQWLENLKRPGLSKKHLAYWIELLLESRISIADVPQEARNPAVWGAAVQANCNSAMAELARRPQERTLETLKAVVQSNPVAIEHLNHEERTYEMCMLAVGGHGQVVRLLTDEQRTPQVCLEAVTNWGPAIRHLTSAQRTPDVCLAAVLYDGDVIEHLTDQERTPEICLQAVCEYPMAIDRLKLKQRTPQVIIAALKGDPRVFGWLTDREITPEVCHAALQVRPALLRDLKPHQRTPEACLQALKASYGGMLSDLSPSEYTCDMISQWVQTHWEICVANTPHDLAKEVATFILKTQEEGAPTEAGSGEENAAWPGPTEHAVRTERPSHAA